MNRRHFLLQSLAVGALAVPARSLWAAPRLRDDFRVLRGKVGVFTGQGGTIGWLVNDTGVAIVDAQFPPSAEALVAGLKARTSVPFDVLLNTHHHGDHTAGNVVLQPHVGRIVGHANVPGLQRASAAQREDAPAPVVPDTTFDTYWQAEIGGETISAAHYGAAHTGGDAIVYFETANVAHMGDLVFNRRLPFIDIGGGASIPGWITVLETAADTYPADTLYIFGHSGEGHDITGTRADVLAMRDFLSGLLAWVQKEVADGATVDDLAAVEHIPGFPEYGTDPRGIRRTVTAAYEEVLRQE